MHDFVLRLAGLSLPCQTRYEDTARFFRAFGGPDCVLPTSQAGGDGFRAPVRIPDPDWNDYLAEGMTDCAHTEYSMLTPYLSDALMPHDRVILHASALRWRERAWLICANSGVGKSTQTRLLQELRPGDFGVICGDRPILQFCPQSDGDLPEHKDTVVVHPSPWNGKENWHGAAAAPLGGLILLERGEENRLVTLSEQEAILPMYLQIIQTGWREADIRLAAALETRLLRTVPIWKLTTNQVPDSTRLLLETVF